MRKPAVAHLFSSAVYHRGMEPPGSHVLLPLGVHPVTPSTSHTLIPGTGAMFDWDNHVSLLNKGGCCLTQCVIVKVKWERRGYLSFWLKVKCGFTTGNLEHSLLGLARRHKPHISVHIVQRYKYRCNINLSATWPKKTHYFVYWVSILNGFRAGLRSWSESWCRTKTERNTQEARAHHRGDVYHQLIILKLITPWLAYQHFR